MQVILTHEQADFDAIASQLGAYLLQRGGFPILPKNRNRNVREFIRLYAADLPFIEYPAIPNEPIKSVTLVDTQSLVTLKGIIKKSQIYVVDHHAKKNDLPSNWEFTQVETSACTTYFVEQLIEKNNIALSLIEATLLLLGIYEDSGSLTYANTTSRDASAVAYLLAKGASLKIAADFLNPSLSDDQQKVFETLLENSKTLTTAGKNILVSSAEALDLGDEVSSIAHKIRELLDTDALFIFVSMKEGIRFVARSTTDQVDVFAIAQNYSGGGHERASAALIKADKNNSSQLEQLVTTFLDSLPGLVKPAITVEQIMSKKPLTITPNTTIDEARTLMQRYGYEGYPVIDGKNIMGLLNRRAIDKAHAHNLRKTAGSLMEAGNIHVLPSDSLLHLQQIMADSGWGQVPVIDPITCEVVGIATRTDLLKVLSGSKTGTGQAKNLYPEMKAQIPEGQFELLEQISTTAQELNTPIYLVGGYVRDLILHRPSPDIDVVVEGDALELASILQEKYSGTITSHKKFGTSKWWPFGIKNDEQISTKLPINKALLADLPTSIDLISARTEFYEKPTALPTITKGSIKLDLHRRDFTINTMAIRLDGDYFGDVYDHWGGLTDLEKKQIRVLHSLSFVDDPTRILRAIRFEQRFGFRIEVRTLQLMQEAASHLQDVSGDRIRHEIEQILIEEKAVEMLTCIYELDLFRYVSASPPWTKQIKAGLQTLVSHKLSQNWSEYLRLDHDKLVTQAAFTIWMMQLPEPEIRKIGKRFRLKSDLQSKIFGAGNLWAKTSVLEKLSPGEFTQEMEKYPSVSLFSNWLMTDSKTHKLRIDMFINEWHKIQPTITGDYFKKLEIPPGPIYRDLLQKIRIAWINGNVTNKDQEFQLLNDLISRIR